VIQEGNNGRDRDRTDDLYRVKVALIPTELRARRRIQRFYEPRQNNVNDGRRESTAAEGGEIVRDGVQALKHLLIAGFLGLRVFRNESNRAAGF
jgi:hypothetical protein